MGSPHKPPQPAILNNQNFILLETQKTDCENYLSYLFLKPQASLVCFNLEEAEKTFAQLEGFLKRGFWAAGFFSYELGYGFEEFVSKKKFPFPLIWLKIFKPPLIFDYRRTKAPAGRLQFLHQDCAASNYRISDIKFNEILADYVSNIKQIKNYISRGLTYQVNYTLKCKFKFQGSALDFYRQLRCQQPVAYAGLIKDSGFCLLSFSPELFFRKQGQCLYVRPMKGTIARGGSADEDRRQMQRLRASAKDQSENIMVVDLLRNDLGRICRAHSIKARRLYAIEKYKSLFQMTSTIQAKLKPGTSFYELFRCLFPSGSVTGAPKIKTMEIIRNLESEERRVYTGAIGFFKPNRDAVFNVAIRTLLIEKGSAEMGIGSGIVYDSDPIKEYKECKLKALFLTSLAANKRRDKAKGFCLIETMRWSKAKGFFLLRLHLQRLKSSAAYFGFPFEQAKIMRELRKATRQLDSHCAHRVRFLLSASGAIKVACRRIKKTSRKYLPQVTFAKKKTDSRQVLLRHKTTRRRLYDAEYQKAKAAGFFDVIFENEKGEISEGAISNIFIRKGKVYYTPPLGAGVLDGTFRRHFIEKKAACIRQIPLRRNDLFSADAVYLTNAVRGMVRVSLLKDYP